MRPIILLFASLPLAACMTSRTTMPEPEIGQAFAAQRVSTHRDGDDLLTGGLGRDALLNPLAPALSDATRPTAAELRRRALHANWRGIADLYGSVKQIPSVPGREYHAYARLPGASQPHRLLTQIPDAFDAGKRCLIVTASSGSRGVYGAIGSVSHYGLPRGCAVVHTDKGTGTGFFDIASGEGAQADGTRAVRGADLEFDPGTLAQAGETRVAIKHAHSGDNPEADWGLHVLQAARFGLQSLSEAFPQQAPFTAANTRIIAFGLSNGGGAVLRAGELDTDGLLDGVVAAAPNVSVGDTRHLFELSIEAALYQPCALLALPNAPIFLPDAAHRAVATARCASLRAAGWIEGDAVDVQAASALARLRAGGWRDETLHLAGLQTGFDLWRAVAALYAQSYARATPDAPVCGYRFAQRDAMAPPRAATASERALWWSDASGIAPTAGVGLVDGRASAVPDASWAGLTCLHDLLDGDDAVARQVRASIAATRASARIRVPTVIVHGDHDSIIPLEFSSRPYLAAARANGARIALWEVANAQHFDAFVALPKLVGMPPLLPQAYAAMDALIAHLDGGAMPGDRTASP
ncbi:MAG TPA: 3-hydroxybutyrate oligomer hydrolase family protein [Patescibacteria group bacterium]|nr:3-hydroxybutyrate oligomer hydrolase family protein [Patescibacteria group bacterium]